MFFNTLFCRIKEKATAANDVTVWDAVLREWESTRVPCWIVGDVRDDLHAVLSLDLLFTNIVLMALQDVQLDAVEVGTLLVAQSARIFLASHTLSGKLKKLAHPEMFLSQLNL